MNFSAKMFDRDNLFMIDFIDTFRGVGHCEREWVYSQVKTRELSAVLKELQLKKYWR